MQHHFQVISCASEPVHDDVIASLLENSTPVERLIHPRTINSCVECMDKELLIILEKADQAIQQSFLNYFLEWIRGYIGCPCWTLLIGRALIEVGELFFVYPLALVIFLAPFYTPCIHLHTFLLGDFNIFHIYPSNKEKK